MAIKYDSNFTEGDLLPSSVVNNIIDSVKENETNIGKKIDKVDGKGLSTNDYTNEEKQKNADNADKLKNLGFQKVYEKGTKTIYNYDDGVYAFSGVFQANESVDVPTVYPFENLMIVNSLTDGTTKYVLLFQSTMGIISYFTITNDSCSEETYNLGNFIKNTDYASADKAGIVQTDIARGIGIVPTDHKLYVNTLTTTDIKDRTGTIGVLPMSLLNRAVIAALTDNKRISDMSSLEKLNARAVIDAEQETFVSTTAFQIGENVKKNFSIAIPYLDKKSSVDLIDEAADSLIITVKNSVPLAYECLFNLISGPIATTISAPADIIKFVGVDCDNDGNFIPSVNTNYEISIKNIGTNETTPVLVARVGVY